MSSGSICKYTGVRKKSVHAGTVKEKEIMQNIVLVIKILCQLIKIQEKYTILKEKITTDEMDGKISSPSQEGYFCYNHIMNYKIILAKNIKYSDIQSENKIAFILDSNNQLPTFDSQGGVRRQFEKLFKAKICFGYIFLQEKNQNAIFASAKIKKLPKNWHYVPYSKLTKNNCKDFDIIHRAMQKLGYVSDFLI